LQVVFNYGVKLAVIDAYLYRKYRNRRMLRCTLVSRSTDETDCFVGGPIDIRGPRFVMVGHPEKPQLQQKSLRMTALIDHWSDPALFCRLSVI
jgi:hypothetical protein